MQTAFETDRPKLLPGMPCLTLTLYSDIPRIFSVWWGSVTDVSETYVTSTTFGLYTKREHRARTNIETSELYRAEQSNDHSTEGRVYPDTPSNRQLIREFLLVSEQSQEAYRRKAFWEKLFRETFRDLIGGLGKSIADEVAKRLPKQPTP